MTLLDNSRLVTSSNESEILVWNIKIGRLLYKFFTNQTVVSLLVAYNGNLLTGCVDGYIREWSLRNGRLVREFYTQPGSFENRYFKSDYMHVIKLAMNSKEYFVSGHQGAYVSVWNFTSSLLIKRLDGSRDLIFLDSLFFNKDGNLVSAFISRFESKIRIDNLESSTTSLIDIENFESIRDDDFEAYRTDLENFVYFKPSQLLVAELSKNCLFASLMNEESGSARFFLYKINLITKRISHFYLDQGDYVSCLYSMLNGNFVIAVNRTLIMLAEEANILYGELNGHSKRIRIISQSLDGTLISYGEDQTIRLWNRTLLDYRNNTY